VSSPLPDLAAALEHHAAGRVGHLRLRAYLEHIGELAQRAQAAQKAADAATLRRLLAAIADTTAAASQAHADAGCAFSRARRALQDAAGVTPP
jgi:hypothetical protein